MILPSCVISSSETLNLQLLRTIFIEVDMISNKNKQNKLLFLIDPKIHNKCYKSNKTIGIHIDKR